MIETRSRTPSPGVRAPSHRSDRSPRLLRAAHYAWLALGVLALTIHGSLIPYDYTPLPWADALARFQQITWAQATGLEPRGDWVISILLYSALGYVLMGALCVDHHRRRGLVALPLVAVFCAVVAVALEFTQQFFPPRTVSLNDIVLECSGGVAGPLVWLLVGQRITKWCRRLSAATGVAGLAGRLLPGYVALVLIVHLMPFDVIFSRTELSVKYQEGKIWLLPFRNNVADGTQYMVQTLVNMACWFPLGFLGTLLTGPRSLANKSASTVLLVGAGAVALVEFLKVFTYSRYSDATHVITGAVAVYLGWRLARACRAYFGRVAGQFRLAFPSGSPARADVWRSLGWGSAFVLWLAVVLYLNWRPFDFDFGLPGLARMSWIPVANYYWSSKYQVFDLFVTKSLTFVPLGVALALRLRDLYERWAALRVVLLAFAVTVLIEAGQLYLPTRTPGVTDMLIETAGAWLGFVAARHLRVVLWAETTLGWGHEFNA
jgi:VanZ family protein